MTSARVILSRYVGSSRQGGRGFIRRSCSLTRAGASELGRRSICVVSLVLDHAVADGGLGTVFCIRSHARLSATAMASAGTSVKKVPDAAK